VRVARPLINPTSFPSNNGGGGLIKGGKLRHNFPGKSWPQCHQRHLPVDSFAVDGGWCMEGWMDGGGDPDTQLSEWRVTNFRY